jgi:regulator of protease activity HflC (stomatin/prohibitin superfamily)
VAIIESLLIMIVLLILITLLSTGTVIIQVHERGFMYRNGKFIGSLNPGCRWAFPYITKVTLLDMQKQGLVTTQVDGLLSRGKVKVGNIEWSARSNGKKISVGRTVKIVGTDEEHIVVEEVV